MKSKWFPSSETIMFNVYTFTIGGVLLADLYKLALFLFVVGIMHALWCIAENTKKKA